jgi:hypothetical protein
MARLADVLDRDRHTRRLFLRFSIPNFAIDEIHHRKRQQGGADENAPITSAPRATPFSPNSFSSSIDWCSSFSWSAAISGFLLSDREEQCSLTHRRLRCRSVTWRSGYKPLEVRVL